MQKSQAILHFLLFVLFFSAGAVALGDAVLSDDLIRYCRNKQLLGEAQRTIERLESLNREYDALLAQLESDPNLLRRIAPATLGTEPADPCAIYPRAKARELAVARKALLEQAGQESAQVAVPKWLERCSEPRRKIALFIAGAGLVLISLVFFTSDASSRRSK
ncbi:MAG: hypothetical protein JW993_12160 [Sedimentisphaerales bacterium]|nr:hypothetical protein [Sedimentisphaerales bacterium]